MKMATTEANQEMTLVQRMLVETIDMVETDPLASTLLRSISSHTNDKKIDCENKNLELILRVTGV